MSKIQVWNDDSLAYDEVFQDNRLVIPPHGFIEMERAAALKFLGTMSPLDHHTGEPKIKKLRIVEDDQQKALRLKQIQASHSCMICGHKLLSEEELEIHVEVHHPEQHKDVKDVKRKK